jgi:DNA-binding NarL/FixJ family response regulator
MTASQPGIIRVLIADDHAVTREGVRSYLYSRPDVEVVGEAADGARAVEMACTWLPQVLLADITMPGMSGIEIARRLGSAAPSVRVLIFTMHEDARFVVGALRAGARGYLLKVAGPEELHAAILRVHAGESFVTDAKSSLLLERARSVAVADPSSPSREVSARQREILSCLVAGMTSREIALHLKVSARTVDGHRAQLRARLGLKRNADLVRYALTHGF